jgi:hypothetical protein
MFRILLTATTALTLMAGVGFAQSSTSSGSTTVVTPGVAPTHGVDVTSTTQKTVDRNGVTIDKDTSGTETSSPGIPAIVQTKTNSTTTHQ